jgi:hypothetical protein
VNFNGEKETLIVDNILKPDIPNTTLEIIKQD